jgi:hypothetical protein
MPSKAGLIGAGVALPEALDVGVMEGEGDEVALLECEGVFVTETVGVTENVGVLVVEPAAVREALNVRDMDGEGDGGMDAEGDRAMHSLVVEEGIQFGALQTHEPAVSVE